MKQAKVLTDSELRVVYSIAKTNRHSLRNVCLLDFSFLCGLRAQELVDLRLCDVLDSQDRIKQEMEITGKGDFCRTVYLSNRKLRRNLAEYLATREGEDGKRPLFLSQKDKFCSSSLQRVFKNLYHEAKIDGASSHSGRRSFATKLIENGFDIKSVSILMGHRSIQMTSRYIQGNPIKLSKMVAVL